MAKILISLLGTGRVASGDNENNKYETTDYILDGKLYPEQTFTSNAIMEHYGINRVYFIGTNKSMWDNIADVFNADDEYLMELLEQKDENRLEENDLKKLNSLIEKKLEENGSKCYLVEDGENENELWRIFEKFLDILRVIDKEDELYFDITHLFRSVSVMSFIMAELAQIDKNIKIKGFFYGMLKKDEASLIIDTSLFFELLQWSKAVEELENFASLKRLVELSNHKLNPNAYNALKYLQSAFDIANMSAIFNAIKKLNTQINHFKKNEDRLVLLFLPRLEQFIKRFSKKSLSEFQLELADFFMEKHNYALSYMALAEAIVSKVTEIQGYDVQEKSDRDKAKQEISQIDNDLYHKIYKDVNKIRNNIAHQLENTRDTIKDIDNLKKIYISETKRIFKRI
jgi:CRISPR-associated Csx2 family protein